jgi:hypothetical protein
MMKISRTRLMLTTLFLLAILTITPVLAATPDTYTWEGEFSYTVPCEGFELVGVGQERLRISTFFDRFGDPVRMQIHVAYDGTLTRPGSNLVLSDPQYAMLQSDLRKGTDTYVGLIYKLTIPGMGIVYQDMGRIVFDADFNVIFEAGTHEFLNGSDTLICKFFE